MDWDFDMPCSAPSERYNFALYSKHAERVTLLLYAESDLVHPMASHRMKRSHVP